MAVDADSARSASHINAFAHLTPPFAGGAQDAPLPLDDTGAASATWPSRSPLLLVGLSHALVDKGLAVSVAVSRGATTLSTVVLDFQPFSEAGALLPAFCPQADQDALVDPFDVHVTLTDAAAGTLARDVIELRLVEGVLGSVLYLLGAEKQRLRREARAISASRYAAYAARDALDRLGADLGVPRFGDALEWDAAHNDLTSRSEREPDDAYRRRLAIFHPFLMSTRPNLVQALNGDAQHPGLPEALGFTGEFQIGEANCEFAIALRLVAAGNDAPRTQFLAFLRSVHLLQPGAALPVSRLLPRLERTEIEAMLMRLAAQFAFPAGAFVARALAEALDRVGRCRAALGSQATPWKVLRAQDDAGGSRFELGLGVEIEAPSSADLDAMADNLKNGTFTGTVDIETQRLLGSLVPRKSGEDPQGRWLLAPAGLKTIHQTAAGLYLSHLPFFGMQLDVVAGPSVSLAAQLQSPGDTGVNAFLFHGLQGTLADAAAAGVPALTPLGAADAAAIFDQAVVPATAALDRAGLRTPSNAADLARAVAALKTVPPELRVVLKCDPAFSTALLANKDDAVDQLQALVDVCRRNEILSLLPLVTGGKTVFLVVGAIALPGAAIVLNARQPGFRWYVLPIQGDNGGLEQSGGARNRYFVPTGSALCAIAAVSMARSDREDPRGCIFPYEVSIDLPAGGLLNLAEYEYVMNLLQRSVPMGVTIDTHRLRETHVDPAGSGTAFPFVGRRAHLFRTFFQPRHLGILNPDQE